MPSALARLSAPSGARWHGPCIVTRHANNKMDDKKKRPCWQVMRRMVPRVRILPASGSRRNLLPFYAGAIHRPHGSMAPARYSSGLARVGRRVGAERVKMTAFVAVTIAFLGMASGFAIGFIFGYFFKQGKE